MSIWSLNSLNSFIKIFLSKLSSSFLPGLSVAITPSSSSSKILITASISLGSDTADRNLNLFVTRGDTEIYKADQSGSNRQRAGGGLHYHHGLSSTVGTYSANIMFLDLISFSSFIFIL